MTINGSTPGACAASGGRAGFDPATSEIGPQNSASTRTTQGKLRCGASVIALYQTSKPHELAREINRLTDGIERDSKLAGQHLATLKAGKPPGITWEHYLKDCGVKISARHADRLIESFQGPTRKSPTKPKPDSDIVSEPDIEIVDDSPDEPVLFSAWQESDPQLRKEFIETEWDGIAPYIKAELKSSLESEQYHNTALREEIGRLRDEIRCLRGRLKETEKAELGQLVADNAQLRWKLEELKPADRCRWVKDDGGRRDAGYPDRVGDCVPRAISIATGRPYAEVLDALVTRGRKYEKSASTRLADHLRRRRRRENYGYEEIYGPYLKSIGWERTVPDEPMLLRPDDLPGGRVIVLLHRHAIAVIDGVIHDTYDSGFKGCRPVESYWRAAW